MVAIGGCEVGGLVSFGSSIAKDFQNIYNKADPQGPASSYNTDSVAFTFGNNYAWAATATPGVYGWTVSAGTAGQIAINTPACDGSAVVLCQRSGSVGSPAGIPTITANSTTGFIISSLNAAGAVLATDLGGIQWQLLNGNFGP
jgi:hypothetical protein